MVNMDWAYHGSHIHMSMRNQFRDGFDFIEEIADHGLRPHQATGQTLRYRKALLGLRYRDRFIYFSTEVREITVYMYGGELLFNEGGMILRFPWPHPYEQDPDSPGDTYYMTMEIIPPRLLQVFIPPLSYYDRFETSPLDAYAHAVRLTRNEKRWVPLIAEDGISNPWIFQPR